MHGVPGEPVTSVEKIYFVSWQAGSRGMRRGAQLAPL